MSVYARIFAAGYDRIMKGPEEATLRAHRAALLAQVRGRVIEIGGGTGANLSFYGPAVEEIVIAEPEEPMVRRLERHVSEHALRARVVRAPAEELPVEDASFDYAISTLVLCTVRDPARALAEIRRVLKPSGRLLFVEHVRAEDPRLAKWQDRLQPLQYRIGHGCHCNRATVDALAAAGFELSELRKDRIKKAAPITSPLVVGAARPT